MKSHTEKLEAKAKFHIYNRGINGEDIFKEERNYNYFLEKYAFFIQPIADTYAYCLLKNHFHVAIQTKSSEEIVKFYLETHPEKKTVPSVYKIISQQFASFFNSYAQAINKSYQRTGGLFEEPFRRILIDNDNYWAELISYIHTNSEKHGMVKDFRNYKHSSYHSHLSKAPTKLKREEVISLFGGEDKYKEFHINKQALLNLEKYMIDFDYVTP